MRLMLTLDTLHHCHTAQLLQELDPVTLHNQALMNMDENPTQGFEKLQFLLQQVPCPPETFANLLLLYLKHEVIYVSLCV